MKQEQKKVINGLLQDNHAVSLLVRPPPPSLSGAYFRIKATAPKASVSVFFKHVRCNF